MKRIPTALIILFLIAISSASAFAEPAAPVEFQCENLRQALVEITGKEIITPHVMSTIYGDVDLMQKGITHLQGIEYLTGARTINLSGNAITDITPLMEMRYLKEINISHNQIPSIPTGLSAFKGLSYLDLSSNPLVQLPVDIQECSQLKWLFLDHTQIERIDDLIGLNDKLEWLSLNGLHLTEWSFLDSLDGLELLRLNQCGLQKLPSIEHMTQLNYLYLADNALQNLPDYLASFRLIRLDASGNMLRQLPESFSQLSDMEQLVLTHNYLEEFPTQVFSMPRLRVLMLGQNLINVIPPGLGQMRYLQRLSFGSNDIRDLHNYSEFIIPYSYQLSFNYNRLNLDDAFTQQVLTDNHNTGGVQKSGMLSVDVQEATLQHIQLSLDYDLSQFPELNTQKHTLDEIVIFNMSDANHPIMGQYPYDESISTIQIPHQFKEGDAVTLRVLLKVKLDTFPITYLYYTDYVTIHSIAATPTPTPSPTLAPVSPTPTTTIEPISTPASSAPELMATDKTDHTSITWTDDPVGMILLGFLSVGILVCIVLGIAIAVRARHSN